MIGLLPSKTYGTIVNVGPTGDATQDTRNILASVATGAAAATAGYAQQVILQPGIYKWSGTVAFTDGVSVIGAGGGFGKAATIIQLQDAASSVTISGGGGITGGFRIDAQSVATVPFQRLGGTHGSGRTFIDIGVWFSAQDSAQFLGAQNDTWINCNFSAAVRDNAYFDQGYGGAVFFRCEFNQAGRYHHNFDVLIGGGVYPKPTDIAFFGGISEGTVGTNVIKSTSSFNIRYVGHALYTSNNLAGDFVSAQTATQDLSFADCWFKNGNGGAAVAGSAAFSAFGAANIIVSGATKLDSFQYAYAVDNTASFIQPVGNVSLYNVTTNVRLTNGGAATQIGSYAISAANYNMTNATDIVLGAYNAARTALRFWVTAAGVIRWGPGTNFTADVLIARQAVGVAGITPATNNQAWSVGYHSVRPTTPVAGTLFGDSTLNAGAGGLVLYNGANWVDPSTGAVK